MKTPSGPILTAILCGLALGSSLVPLRPDSAAAAELGDRTATEHLTVMERTGVDADPFWANAFWARSATAPTPAARISDLRWALRFDPDLHAARRELIGALARSGESEFASQTVTLLSRSGLSFSAQQWGAFAAMTVLGPALLAGLALFGLLAIGKSLPRIHHGLRERLHFLPTDIREAATLLTLFLPLVLALTLPPTSALFWTLLLGTVGTWKILDRWERRITLSAAAGLLLAPMVLAGWTRLAEPARPDSYLQCLWATQSTNDASAGAILRRIPPPDATKDPDHFATLALLDRRAGRFESAIRHLTEAIRLAPDQWKYHNNLGNALLLTGNVDAALTAYGDALTQEPSAALVHVNRSQAWVRRLEFTRADGDIARAGDLGYHFPRLLPGNSEALVVRDHGIAASDAWQLFLRGTGMNGALPWSRAGRMSLGILLPMNPAWMSFPLFLAIWYVALARHLHRIFSCATCSKLISRKSHFRVLRRSLCADCYTIRQSVTAPLRREELLEERRQHVAQIPRTIGTLLAILLPGTGQLLAGQPRRAGAGLVTAAILIAFVVAGLRLAPTAGALGVGNPPMVPVVLAGLAYALLAVASMRAYHRPRPTTDAVPSSSNAPNSPDPRST